jgi:GH24 family phage-related lysozyme (muramidase)
MINKKNDWYSQAKRESELIQEAGMSDTIKKAILAVSLIFGGYSVFEVAERTGLTPEQVNQAVNNQQIVDLIEKETLPITELPIPTEEPQQVDTQQGLSTALNMSEIERLIRLHEVSGTKRFVTVRGKKVDIRKVYEDPIHGWKVPTIGVGFNLNRPDAPSLISSFGLDYNKVRSGQQTLTDEQVNILYRHDIKNAMKDAKTFLPSFDQQPTQVKTILVDMSFNMGLDRLSTFKNFKKALENFDFPKALKEMRDSNWAKQTKTRAERLSGKMIEVIKETTPSKNQKDPEIEEKPILTN